MESRTLCFILFSRIIFVTDQRGAQGKVDKISLVLLFSPKQELGKFLRAGSLDIANSLGLDFLMLVAVVLGVRWKSSEVISGSIVIREQICFHFMITVTKM